MGLMLLFLPLLSFFICILFGRHMGGKGVKLYAPLLNFINCILAYFLFKEVYLLASVVYLPLGTWFDLGLLSVQCGLQLDSMVAAMLILITTISFFVHLFSTSYMATDPHLPRFMAYLSLFTFFMLVLVTSPNFLQLFIGWEGVGLCSYLLINFWFTRIQANKAAIKAMVINKVGDLALLVAISLLWIALGTLEYDAIFCLLSVGFKVDLYLSALTFCLLLAVIGKSAQIGLHTWLPDAMEGPTPVSALIHAATMVTAGVFLIIRASPLFEKSPFILLLIVCIGSLTAFFTATIALAQTDLKKVIAYSTCSQLGYMVMVCGFSQYTLSLFHLLNHGFFKALLFLSAGSIIHALGAEQDIRKLGSLKRMLPLTYVCVLIASFSLMGLPFLTGFYSKELILEVMYGSHLLAFAFWLALLSALLTALYAFRLLFYVFIHSTQTPFKLFKKVHEANWSIVSPLVALLIASMLIGYVAQYPLLKAVFPIVLPNSLKFLPFYMSIGGAFASLYLGYQLSSWWTCAFNAILKRVYAFTSGGWYVEPLLTTFITLPLLKFGFNVTYKLIDNQLLEFLGPTSLKSWVLNKTSALTKLHLGQLAVYTFMFIVFILLCCLNCKQGLILLILENKRWENCLYMLVKANRWVNLDNPQVVSGIAK